jgi:hypothetical protein
MSLRPEESEALASFGRTTNARRESVAVNAAKTEVDDRYLVRGEGGTLASRRGRRSRCRWLAGYAANFFRKVGESAVGHPLPLR